MLLSLLGPWFIKKQHAYKIPLIQVTDHLPNTLNTFSTSSTSSSAVDPLCVASYTQQTVKHTSHYSQ